MEWLKSLFSGKSSAAGSSVTRRVTHDHPLVIKDPTIGFLNLMGAPAGPLVNEDMAALKPLFAKCHASEGATPVCDVLMIYATIGTAGEIQNTPRSLRELIHESHAPIAVVATENGGPAYIAASKGPGEGKANLVMTLKRNGEIFPKFFGELFGLMHNGVTMPMAWVKLAPQGPGMVHKNVPETICAMQVTHILFQRVAGSDA